jgi:hypothetical protein
VFSCGIGGGLHDSIRLSGVPPGAFESSGTVLPHYANLPSGKSPHLFVPAPWGLFGVVLSQGRVLFGLHPASVDYAFPLELMSYRLKGKVAHFGTLLAQARVGTDRTVRYKTELPSLGSGQEE